MTLKESHEARNEANAKDSRDEKQLFTAVPSCTP
jgi:hypothetical protein